MAQGKKYYWLKLKDDFFSSKRIKKLRRLAGGDTYTIIYLKMQLLAMKNDGVLEYTGLEKSFPEELSLDLDEDVDNVRVTVSYLLGCGLLETSDEISYLLPYAVENTGSEGACADRVRRFRERQKTLQCNTSETPLLRSSNVEIEKEIEKDTEIEKRKSKSKKKDICTEPQAPAVLTLLLNDKSEYPITQEDIDGWSESYPAVDVLAQLKAMKSWCKDNPTRRKTSGGIRRFVNSWLSKEQDKYHPAARRQQEVPDTTNPFLQMLMEGEDDDQ